MSSWDGKYIVDNINVLSNLNEEEIPPSTISCIDKYPLCIAGEDPDYYLINGTELSEPMANGSSTGNCVYSQNGWICTGEQYIYSTDYPATGTA
jgi:hypothetical protein